MYYPLSPNYRSLCLYRKSVEHIRLARRDAKRALFGSMAVSVPVLYYLDYCREFWVNLSILLFLFSSFYFTPSLMSLRFPQMF